MPPRKSQGGAPAAAGKGDADDAADGGGVAAQAGAEVTSDAAAAAAAPQPISYQTKQQRDAAKMGDGIDQYELARTQITKVAKTAIPDNIQLRKEVIMALMKSSTIFINYLASAALDKTHEAGNKTLSANHVLSAFKEMGFPEESTAQLRKEYQEKIKLEADRAKASKAAKADAAKADEQSMDVDGDERGADDLTDIRALGDESIAVDLSKEGAEGEMDEDDNNEEDENGEEEGVEEEEDGGDAEELDDAIGGHSTSPQAQEEQEEDEQ